MFDNRHWTDRQITVQNGPVIESKLAEYIQMIGGKVRRRWVLQHVHQETSKYMGTKPLTDRDVKKYYPEVELPDPPVQAGKTREELVLLASKGELE